MLYQRRRGDWGSLSRSQATETALRGERASSRTLSDIQQNRDTAQRQPCREHDRNGRDGRLRGRNEKK